MRIRLGGPLSILSHIINFGILIYIFLGSVDTPCFKTSDLIISFIGLFVSLFVNIVSVIELKD